METETRDGVEVKDVIRGASVVKDQSSQQSTVTRSGVDNYDRDRGNNLHRSRETFYVELSPWMYASLQFVSLGNVIDTAVRCLPSTAVVGPVYPSIVMIGPGYPSTAVLSPGYPVTAVLNPGYSSTALLGPGYPSTAVLSPGYPGTAVLGLGYPGTAVLDPGYPNDTVVAGPGMLSNNIHFRRLHFYASMSSVTRNFATAPHHGLIQTLTTGQQTFSFTDLCNIFSAQERNLLREMLEGKMSPFVTGSFCKKQSLTRQPAAYQNKGKNGAFQYETSHDTASEFVNKHKQKLVTQALNIDDVNAHIAIRGLTIPDATSQNVTINEATHDKPKNYVATNDLTTDVSTFDLTTDVSTYDLTTDVSTYDLTTDVSTFDLTTDVSTYDLTTDVSTYDLTTDVSTYDLTTDVSTYDLTTDVSTYDLTTDVSIFDLSTQDVSTYDLTTKDVSTNDLTTHDLTTDLTTDVSTYDLTTDQSTQTLTVNNEANQIVEQFEGYKQNKTVTDHKIKHENFKDELLNNMCSQLESFIKSLTLGKKMESQPIVLALENQPGELESEKQPGELEYEKQPGELESEKQPGELEYEKQPCELESEKQLDELDLKKQPCELESEKQPCELESKKQPCELESEKQPGELGSEKQPGELESDKQPCELESEKQPCEIESEKQPGELDLEKQPCEIESEKQPCEIESEKQPGEFDLEKQLGKEGLDHITVEPGLEDPAIVFISETASETENTQVVTNIDIISGLDSSTEEVSDRLKLFEFFPPKGNISQTQFTPNKTPKDNLPNSTDGLGDTRDSVLNSCPADDSLPDNCLNLTTDPMPANTEQQQNSLFPQVFVSDLPRISVETIPSQIAVSTGQQATQEIRQQATQQPVQQQYFLPRPIIGNNFCQMPTMQANPFLFANHNLPQFQHPMVANPVYDNRFYHSTSSTTFTVPPSLLMFPPVGRWQQVPVGRPQSAGVDGRMFQGSQSSFSQVNNNSWGQQTQGQSAASQWESLDHGSPGLVVGQSVSVSTRASVNSSKQARLPRGQSAFAALSHHRQMYVPSERTYATAWRNEYDPMLKKIRLLAYRVMKNDLNLFDLQCAEQILTTAAHLKDINITCVVTNGSEWRVSMDNILLGFASGQWIQARERAYSIALQKILSCDLRLVRLDKDFLELHVFFEKLNQPNWMNSADVWSEAAKRKDIIRKSNKNIISSRGPMDKFKHVDEVILMDPDSYKLAAGLLWDSVTSCDMLLEYEVSLEAGRIYCCKVKIENSLVADGCAYNKEDAIEAAATQTVNRLKEVCWVIETKPDRCEDVRTVDKTGISLELEGHFALKEDNIGYKLLKKMGWSGGGIGKNETGITKPVSCLSQNTRKGLGHESAKEGDFQFKCFAHEFLMAYANASDLDDMVFSSREFSHEEMDTMCSEGEQFMNLEVNIETKGDEKLLCVSKKRSPYELFDLLMLNKGETTRYRLKSPGTAEPEVKVATTTATTTKKKKPKQKKEKGKDVVQEKLVGLSGSGTT